MPSAKPRLLAVVTAVLGALVLTIGAGAPAAQAKPPIKPGPVTGLALTLTKPADNYTASATWNAATNATTYTVVLANATTGATLVTNSVGVTSWSASVNLTGVTQVRLTVTPLNGNRPGPAATVTQQVADLSAPNGTYTTSWVNRTGTITQTSLTDDGPIGQITRTVSWGDNSAPEAWSNGNTISHLYAADGLYRPTVTLKDAQGNTRVVVVPAIVPGDKTAPTGTFTTGPAKVWQQVTTVNLTQTALSDDFSPAANVLRSIDWADGSPVAPWTTGVSATHVYAAAGTYTPVVILKDEAGNTRAVVAPLVHVDADTVAPVVTLTKPRKGVADEVSSWKRLAGTASDTNGTGVATVAVRAIEKRGSSWYFYKAGKKVWTRTTTKAKAWKRTSMVSVTPTAKGAWTTRLASLRKGTLLLKTSGTDLAGNDSKPLTTKAVLTAA